MGQVFVGGPANDELDGFSIPAAQPLPHDREGADAREIGQFSVDLLDDRVGRPAICPIVQDDDDKPLIEARRAEPGRAHQKARRFARLRIGQQPALNLVEIGGHVVEGRPFLAPDADEEAATVFARDIFLVDILEEQNSPAKDTAKHERHEDGAVNQPIENPAIAGLECRKCTVDDQGDDPQDAGRRFWLEQLGRQHRHQRE